MKLQLSKPFQKSYFTSQQNFPDAPAEGDKTKKLVGH